MRAAVLISVCLGPWLGLAAGCFENKLGNYAADPSPDDDGHFPGQPSCAIDTDCALAAATCCECPTFAVSTLDPVYQACRGVECPDRECAANVTARCNDRQECELACAPAVCDVTSCPAGYAIDDASGCLSCACAVPATTCTLDTDCVQTRADCCGCANGGTDTAVPRVEQAAYDEMLGCMADPQCPGVDACEAGAAPRCVQGRCELLAGGLPPGACGRADLPACGAGEVCMVNANDQGNMHGVGVCQPPP
ncbi:MAG: hypothetical protein WKG01_07085 [Kofleriaceae bacterium]